MAKAYKKRKHKFKNITSHNKNSEQKKDVADDWNRTNINQIQSAPLRLSLKI